MIPLESESAKKGGGAAVGTRPIDMSRLDLRVGHIVSVEKVLPVSSYLSILYVYVSILCTCLSI